MKIRSTTGLLSLIGMFALLLGGCSGGGGGGGGTTTPLPKFYFKASDTTSSVTSEPDLFGNAVALSGDGSTLAIGAYAEDSDGSADTNNGIDGAGAVYVFKRTVSASTVSWAQVAYVKAELPVIAGDNFGFSVSLSEDGNRLAVGAPGRDNVGTNEGAVYVYSGPNYDTPFAITASDGQDSDRFGQSVALSDDGLHLAVGANLEDGGAGDPASNSGAVYVYTDGMGTGTSWLEDDILRAPAPQADAQLGVSVALNQDGSVLAAGAWLEDDLAATDDRGAAYVFLDTAGTWSAGSRYQASNRLDDDRFGSAIALSDDGTRLAVGAPGDIVTSTGVFAGAAYAFTCSVPPTCTEEQIITATNDQADDAFGIAVSLSSDGNKLLVGALDEDGGGTGIGSTVNELATGAGAAYLFTRDTVPSWTQQLYIKATNTDAGDRFGSSVSLSDDGNQLVVGAPLEDSNATGVNGDQADDTAADAGAAYLWNLI